MTVKWIANQSVPIKYRLMDGSVFHLNGCAHGLADVFEQLYEPIRLNIEGFAALDALKLDGAELVAVRFVFAHDAALSG